MNPSPDTNWTPGRELLAAFADGELDCRPDLAWMRCRIENWLAKNPEAAADLDAQISLAHLMAETKPSEPATPVWEKTWSQIKKARIRNDHRRAAAWWWFAGVGAAGIAAALVLIMMQQNTAPPGHELTARANMPTPEPMARPDVPAVEPTPVLELARPEEVEILHVAAADAGTLVACRLPWSEPMVLANPDEVVVQSPLNSGAGMQFRLANGSAAIIWMLLPGGKENVP